MRRSVDQVIADALPLARLTRERDRLRTDVKALTHALAKAEARASLAERVSNILADPPDWAVRLMKGGLNRGILAHDLSDCHFDEVVNPAEVEGYNAFSRAIAVKRLKRDLERVVLVERRFCSGLKFDGFVLVLGGDLLSGAIHEELIETNEDTVYGSLDFWAEQLVAFVGALADAYKKVHVVCIVGNHGRRTRKPVAKRRVRDNLDWLLYRTVARIMKDDRVTWQIPESADADFTIYTTRFRATHGDQFHGGSGISGAMAPVLLGHHRKTQQQIALRKEPYDWLVVHHWHQYTPPGRGIMMNGSLKGYDEYAYTNPNMKPEPPQQAFWLTTPEYGVTFHAPVFCGDRKSEGW